MYFRSVERKLCEYFLMWKSSIIKPCSNPLCEHLNQSECPLCDIINKNREEMNTSEKINPNQVYFQENKQCENCLSSEKAVDRSCTHAICDDCYTEFCPICALLHRDSLFTGRGNIMADIYKEDTDKDRNSGFESSEEFAVQNLSLDSPEKTDENSFENASEGRDSEVSHVEPEKTSRNVKNFSEEEKLNDGGEKVEESEEDEKYDPEEFEKKKLKKEYDFLDAKGFPNPKENQTASKKTTEEVDEETSHCHCCVI